MQDLLIRHGDLAEVAAALNERKTLSDDYVILGTALILNDRGRLVLREGGNDGMPVLDSEYDLTRLASGQLADRLDIPAAYWRRLGEHPLLAAENVNYWLARDGRKWLIRALRDEEGGPGLVRAVLSNSYAAMDDVDVLMAALQGITAAGVEARATVDLTDRRMVAYIEAPGIEVNAPELLKLYRDPRTGRSGKDYPIVSAGITVSNSEVGQGRFTVMPRIVFRVCTNGMTRPADGMAQVHLGGKLEEGKVNWSAETQRANIDLVMKKARDAVATFLDRSYLERVIAELQPLAEHQLTNSADVIERVSRTLVFTEAQQTSILDAFIKGGDTSALGVAQAVTYVAQNEPDGEWAYYLENSALKAAELAASVR